MALKNSAKSIILLSFSLIFISGCAPTFRANKFLNEKIRGSEVVAVMPMDVDVYKVSAGGVKELVDEYSEEAKENITFCLEEKLAQVKGYQLRYFPAPQDIDDPSIKQLLKDTLVLFEAVNMSIIMHTYETPYNMMIPQKGIFVDKIKDFDYSLGPQINPLSEYFPADLFLFIKGGDSLSSGGRIALMTLLVLVNAASGTVTYGTNAGPPHLSAALVEPATGDILWYNFFGPEGGYNFRNQKSVSNFTDILLKDFPQNK